MAWGDSFPGAHERGRIFNIQKYCLHDGPGIRTTVFLKGCPLECIWCHNPEGIDPGPEILRNQARCLACGECRRACPFGSTAGNDLALPTSVDGCLGCDACLRACPTEARQRVGREMSVAEVLREVGQDQIFYDDCGGGVTFSGGEPLMQPRFLLALLQAAKARGLHTCVDTSGYGCTHDLLSAARFADLFLYDLKQMNDAEHRALTGVSNAPILENLLALDRVHDRIWIRVPLIPGLTDSDANLFAIARLVASLAGVRQVNLLPYHRTGTAKLTRLGINQRHALTPGAAAALPELNLNRAAEIFGAFGLNPKVGG